MDDLNKTLTQIQIDIAAIRTDLNYHIKRTDILEEEVKSWRQIILFIGGFGKLLALVAIIGTATATILSLL